MNVMGLRQRGLAAVVVAGCLWAVPAAAQVTMSDIRTIENRLDALEKQMGAVQQQGTRAVIASGGGNVSGNIAQSLSDRMDSLESRLGTLLNQQEEGQYQLRQLQTRLDKLVADMDFRLSALEKGGTGGGQSSSSGGPTPSIGSNAPGLAPPEGNLGTIGKGAPQQTASAPNVQLPPGNAQERYDFSYKLLLQGDYAKAEQAFAEWIKAYSDDKLAGNAQYWLAETFYARRDYDKAAKNFLVGYQKYPKSPKAPDSLVKLGMSLTNLNQKAEACKVFRQLNADFPNPPPSVKQLATAERARAGCSN